MIKHMFGRLGRSWRPPHQGADEKGIMCVLPGGVAFFHIQGLKMHCQNTVDGSGVQKEFFKNIFVT